MEDNDFLKAWAQLRSALRQAERAALAIERIMKIEPERAGKTKLELLQEILLERPGLTIEQIVDALRGKGFVFYGANPKGATRADLYGRSDLFHSEKGHFFVRVREAGETKK